jgi:hypothetical protein
VTTVGPVVAPLASAPSARRGLAIALGALVVVAAAALMFVLLRSTAASAPEDAAIAVAPLASPIDAPVARVATDAAVPVDAAVADATVAVVVKPVAHPPPAPRLGRVVLIAKGAASATFSYDGKRVTGARLDAQLAVGPHTVTVEANGVTRTLRLDVTTRGVTRTVELPAPAVDDRGLMQPGTLRR